MNNNEKNKKKINLKEMWHEKKGRAKIKLLLYGIFLIGVIIFARVLGAKETELENKNPTNNSFIKEISDNYEYDIEININDSTYKYQGKRLGYNGIINRTAEGETKKYSIINNKYYINENENYLLTTEEEVYPYLNYRYLNLDNIKSYINMSENNKNDNNTYNLKVSSLLLDGSSDKYITFTLDEENTSLIIDYSELFRELDSSTNKVIVNYNLKNIGNITSLDNNN